MSEKDERVQELKDRIAKLEADAGLWAGSGPAADLQDAAATAIEKELRANAGN